MAFVVSFGKDEAGPLPGFAPPLRVKFAQAWTEGLAVASPSVLSSSAVPDYSGLG